MKYVYTFDFDALTIADLRDLVAASTSADFPLFLSVIAKCLPGMYELPFREMTNVCTQFAQAMKQQTNSMHDTVEVPDAIRLLRQMFNEQSGSG